MAQYDSGMPPKIAPWLAEVMGRERGGKGWKKTELARRAGIDRSTLDLVESPEGNPTVETLEKLCETLGTSLAAVFAEADRRRRAGSPGKTKPDPEESE